MVAVKKNKEMAMQARIEDTLRRLGAHEYGANESGGSYKFKMMTKAGWLFVSPREANVFCRFDEPARAINLLGTSQVNPHSGKWNFHGLDNSDFFIEEIERLALPPQLGHGDQTQLVALPGSWEQVNRHFFTRDCGDDGYLAATLTDSGLLLEAWAPDPKKPDYYVAAMTKTLTLVEIPMGAEVMIRECEEALRKPALVKELSGNESPSP